MMNCNTLLMIGTELSLPAVFPERRDRHPGRHPRPNSLVVAPKSIMVWSVTPKTTLRALLPYLKQSADDEHLKSALEHYRKARKGLDELANRITQRKGSHPQFASRALLKRACRVGRDLHLRRRHTDDLGVALPDHERQTPAAGPLFTARWPVPLPQAIGAQSSHKTSTQVISMSGDGGRHAYGRSAFAAPTAIAG